MRQMGARSPSGRKATEKQARENTYPTKQTIPRRVQDLRCTRRKARAYMTYMLSLETAGIYQCLFRFMLVRLLLAYGTFTRILPQGSFHKRSADKTTYHLRYLCMIPLTTGSCGAEWELQ